MKVYLLESGVLLHKQKKADEWHGGNYDDRQRFHNGLHEYKPDKKGSRNNGCMLCNRRDIKQTEKERKRNRMRLCSKNSGKISGIVPEERMKVLLSNAIDLYAEAHADRYNSSSEFWEFLYDELGTDKAEIKELGIDLSDSSCPED